MRSCLLALMALALSACGGPGPDPSAAKSSTAGAAMPTFGGDDAVAAVRETTGTPVAQLRFVIDTRPVAGKPFRVQLIASAGAPVAELAVGIESPTLRVDPSGAALALEQAGSDTARQFSANHDFNVFAQEEGLAELRVRLATDADTPETVYVIPVLVAKAGADNGAAAPPSEKAVVKPDPAAGDDNAKPEQR